jgi:hypothetical protein
MDGRSWMQNHEMKVMEVMEGKLWKKSHERKVMEEVKE